MCGKPLYPHWTLQIRFCRLYSSAIGNRGTCPFLQILRIIHLKVSVRKKPCLGHGSTAMLRLHLPLHALPHPRPCRRCRQGITAAAKRSRRPAATTATCPIDAVTDVACCTSRRTGRAFRLDGREPYSGQVCAIHVEERPERVVDYRSRVQWCNIHVRLERNAVECKGTKRAGNPPNNALEQKRIQVCPPLATPATGHVLGVGSASCAKWSAAKHHCPHEHQHQEHLKTPAKQPQPQTRGAAEACGVPRGCHHFVPEPREPR